jgi:hypothetical protein
MLINFLLINLVLYLNNYLDYIISTYVDKRYNLLFVTINSSFKFCKTTGSSVGSERTLQS